MPYSSSHLATLGGHTMGTSWSVKLITPVRCDLHRLHAGIQQHVDEVVAQMSTWEAQSDISRYNRAPAGYWQVLPDMFWQVLDCACDIAQASSGAFDPAIGALVALWGFGAQAEKRTDIPQAHHLNETARCCGWHHLQRNRQTQAVLQPGGLQLDLSAIAKGFAVDLVSRWLRAQNIAAALVEIGGELHGYGRKPDGQPWQVLVESSPDRLATAVSPARVLALDNLAVATSGDYWHHYTRQGNTYSHTLDPIKRTPIPANHAAVTVLDSQAMRADAWATALTVMGPEQGLDFARTHHLAARFVRRNGNELEEILSPAFAQHLGINA